MALQVKGRGYVISPAVDLETRKGGAYQSLIVNCGDAIKRDHWYLSSFGPSTIFPELEEGDLIDFTGTITKWVAKDAKGQLLKNAFQLAVTVSAVTRVPSEDTVF